MPGEGLGCCEHAAALQRVALDELSECRLDEISVGQQQRDMFARVMVQQSRVLLLDEPCAAIDPLARDQLLQLMRQLVDAGLTLLVSSDNCDEALNADDCEVVLDAVVLADGTPSEVGQTLGKCLRLGNYFCG